MEQRSNISAYADRLTKGNEKYKREMAHRRQEAKIEAERLAEVILFEIPDIKQLWGFGSVFEKSRPFTKNSDIDFAIEGGNFLTAFKIVERSSFKVDLIDITRKNDSFSAHIREHGKALL